MRQQVQAWVEEITIPTYPVGNAEKNPMFLEKRVYQGSSGVVYPHPVVEKISDEKIDKTYTGVFLENDFIKMLVLPELGGRIQMAFDKVKQRHFIYYNQVIKPALVGLTGPWISGGIEFNWPQHHRPSTFDPVDFKIEESSDGSKTIWVNEVERMFRTKGMAGFTLRPDKAYIEIKGKLYNRTPFPQTFLWWANPAVKVNESYQSIFPPDVYAVFDHGKRDVSSFPVANGIYYKVDYSPGTGISRYKNIAVPTSYMAITSKYNFIGGYEHDTQAGLLHVADHHISPGKKQWTWGHGEFGQAWDKNLTDADGPYIELMTGVFTDNQPDFSWLQPFEEKTFTQYFMPYRDIGEVKNASKEAVLGVEFGDNGIHIKLYVTGPYKQVKISLTCLDREVFVDTVESSPTHPYIRTVKLADTYQPENIRVTITNLDNNKVLISYQQAKTLELEIPPAAQAAKRPAEVENNEQLYLTGLHLEQYRHATYSATDYYEEALHRDVKDVRNNNALGLWHLRRGKFAVAEPYFRTAISTLTQRNPNPYDGEAFYNLGWSLKMQGRHDEAFDAFYKCVWNDAWQHSGFLNLARIATLKHDYEQALDLVEKSIIRNYHSHTARHLKAAILRKLGLRNEALQLVEQSLVFDPFNYGCLFEKYLIFLSSGLQNEAQAALHYLLHITRNWEHNFIEYAIDYIHAGLYEEALQLLTEHSKHKVITYPMTSYYLGWLCAEIGQTDNALKHFKQAAAPTNEICFSNRIEDVAVLKKAIEINEEDARAYYYLGNFWYDKRQYADAIACWEKSAIIDNSFPTVHRNLSLAYFNKKHQSDVALVSMEQAFFLDTSDARVLMELDQLYRRLNTPLKKRLAFLENYLPLVVSREDLYLERITIYNQLGKYQTAKDLISAITFHPWEGGEGKVVGQYLIAHIGLAREAIAAARFEDALALLEAAGHYPDNLGEGKLLGTQENDLHYLKGLAYESFGDATKALKSFLCATEGISEPVQAIFYNDPQPDKIFYQGLAWLKLNNVVRAQEIFKSLINFGKKHLNDKITIDYFAVSLPDLLVFDADLNLRNKVHCLYLQALGNLGLGNEHLDAAELLFDEVLNLDVNHQGALIHRSLLGQALTA